MRGHPTFPIVILPLVAGLLSAARADAGPLAGFVRAAVTGVRSVGMGGTGVADADDTANIFVNPALAASARGLFVNGGFDNWEPDVNHFDFAVGGGRPWDTGSALSVGGSLIHTRADLRVRDPDTGQSLQTHSSYMTAAAGAGWTGRETSAAVGVSVKWSTDGDGEPVAFDVGGAIGARNDMGTVRVDYALAGVARNMGTDDDPAVFTTENAREEFRIGASLRATLSDAQGRKQHSATINVDAIDLDDGLAGGLEIVGWNIISLRAGLSDRALSYLSGHTLGAGITGHVGLFSIRLDYSRVSASNASARLNAFGTTMWFSW